jgi:hypothetical protein
LKVRTTSGSALFPTHGAGAEALMSDDRIIFPDQVHSHCRGDDKRDAVLLRGLTVQMDISRSMDMLC